MLDFASDQFSYSNLNYFTNGTLQVAEAKNTDISIYKCLVDSVSEASAGNDNKMAYLNVVELLYAPCNLNTYLYQPEKCIVTLTWTGSFDGKSPILKYIGQARILIAKEFHVQMVNDDGRGDRSLGNDWFVIKDNIYETPHGFQQAQPQSQTTHWTLMSQLPPAIMYEFRVSAINSTGE